MELKINYVPSSDELSGKVSSTEFRKDEGDKFIGCLPNFCAQELTDPYIGLLRVAEEDLRMSGRKIKKSSLVLTIETEEKK